MSWKNQSCVTLLVTGVLLGSGNFQKWVFPVPWDGRDDGGLVGNCD